MRAVDRNGNRLSYNRDGFEHASGLRLRLVRDALGRIASASAGDGETWTYAYTAEGDLLSVTDPDERTSTYGYLASPAHFLASVTDAFGRTGDSFEYDASGRLVAIVDPQGNRVLQSWDPLGFTGTVTDGRGNVTRLTYDQRGNVLTSTDPLGRVTSYLYGDTRHPDEETRVTDALGQQTRYTYDASGNVLSVMRPPDTFWETEVWTYSSRNQPLTFDRAGGFRERWQYDERGNLIQEGQAFFAEPVITYTYTPEGQVETLTLDGGTTRTLYDTTGLPREITGPNGLTLTYTRDGRGRITHATTAEGGNVSVSYHPDGSGCSCRSTGVPASVTDAAGASAGTELNDDGSLTVHDWNGRSTRFYTDARGKPVAIRGPDGFLVDPVYDANGNIT
jgi:YD repeat-containing protein